MRLRSFSRPARLTKKWSALRNDSGSAAIEFAMVALPFFMFVLGIIGVGLYYFTSNALEHGVEAASRKILTGEAQKGDLTVAAIPAAHLQRGRQLHQLRQAARSRSERGKLERPHHSILRRQQEQHGPVHGLVRRSRFQIFGRRKDGRSRSPRATSGISRRCSPSSSWAAAATARVLRSYRPPPPSVPSPTLDARPSVVVWSSESCVRSLCIVSSLPEPRCGRNAS